MKVFARIGYHDFLADLSGTELEALTKVMAKFYRVDHTTTIDGASVNVMSEPPVRAEFEARIQSDGVRSIKRSEYDRHFALEQKAARQTAVRAYREGGTAEGLIDDLYGNEAIQYTDKKYGVRIDHVDNDRIEFIAKDQTGADKYSIAVKNDGSFTRVDNDK